MISSNWLWDRRTASLHSVQDSLTAAFIPPPSESIFLAQRRRRGIRRE
jgi:hypothetical protein